MSTDKEQWKDEIMDSLSGMQHARAPEFMYTRIMARLQNEMERPVSLLIPVKRIWVALACFILLCAINIGLLKSMNHTGGQMRGSSPYSVDNTNFNLY